MELDAHAGLLRNSLAGYHCINEKAPTLVRVSGVVAMWT